MPADLPPVNEQVAVISATLNAGMLLNFLMGIYTMVYAGTMYFYTSKKPVNNGRRVVLSTVSTLYLLSMGSFIINWYYLNLAVVIDGDTRSSIFISTVNGGSISVFALYDFLFFSTFVVADGLLIWRCYHVWGMSVRIILIPSILLVAESGLLISITVLLALNVPFTSNAATGDDLITAQVFLSLGTTVISTSLIGYRIYSASRPIHASSRGRFSHVVTIVVESAAAYSVAIIIYAIVQVLPSGYSVGSPSFQAGSYVQAWLSFVAGIAPTVLVARISNQTRIYHA